MYSSNGVTYIGSSGRVSLSRSHFKGDLEEVSEQDLQICGVFQKVGVLRGKHLPPLGSKNNKGCVPGTVSEGPGGRRCKGSPAHGRTCSLC